MGLLTGFSPALRARGFAAAGAAALPGPHGPASPWGDQVERGWTAVGRTGEVAGGGAGPVGTGWLT